MIKIRLLFALIIILHASLLMGQDKYILTVKSIDSTNTHINIITKQKTFSTKTDAEIYVEQLLPSLQAKGFVTASLDSVYSNATETILHVFLGEQYKWNEITIDDKDQKWLSAIGWNEKQIRNQNFDYNKIAVLQERLLNHFENMGHPFAKISIDSFYMKNGLVNGKLSIQEGPLYHIDSLRVVGNAKISSEYLQNFLEIKNGSLYNKEKLNRISSLLKKLNYVEETFPPKLYWSASGSYVELYLKQKKSSQLNLIIGFLPNNDQQANKKMLITGEGLLNLKNALGGGETIGLVWQRLQAQSQRLNIVYQQPYLLKSPFGIDFNFDMLKRDSSYLNFEYKIGAQYFLNTQQSAKLYFHQFSTIISNVNTNLVLQTKKLPNEADIRLLDIGLEYEANTTNYIYNPVSGFVIYINTSLGSKTIKRNDQIIELEDENNPDFEFASLYDTVKLKSSQWRTLVNAANYFPIGKHRRSTVKLGINGGFLSGSNIFRNELFQIGGYRLLRGFDEQSQFHSQYAIGTLEYRYLIGQNSYFNVFADGGWGKNASRGFNLNYTYISGGLGLAFETKFGVFNLAWAVGKRNDSNFNLRQSKIHFGFVSYF